jgi:hypothetical protein
VQISKNKLIVWAPKRRVTADIGAKWGVLHIQPTNGVAGLEEAPQEGHEKKCQLLKNHHAII